MGYLWMSVVTFMHDCVHGVLFKASWKNWAFGIFSTIPIIITFVSFREDHLDHHRYNRSARDPDAFTMGKRSALDFLLFYAYIVIGGVLTIIQFSVIYPLQKFDRRESLIHGFELRQLVRLCSHHGAEPRSALLNPRYSGGFVIWSKDTMRCPFESRGR
jgi:fatty acid desaturase